MAVLAANVCRRFFKYLFWYFCSSAIEPLSACILFGDIFSCCGDDSCMVVVTDDSDDSPLDDDCDKGSGFWLNFSRETVIFGDGVNAEVIEDDEAQSFDEKLLTLLLVFAYKFNRLSICTLFSTIRMAACCCCDNNDDTLWPFSSSSSSSMCGNVNGKWLCDERDETFDGDDCCCCCCCCVLDKLPDVETWLILELVHDAGVSDDEGVQLLVSLLQSILTGADIVVK